MSRQFDKKECAGMLPDPLAMERIPGGRGHNADPAEFDQDQLMKGIHIELEHGSDVATALEIAMDHLTENPFYYDYLEKMEKDMERKSPKLEDVYCQTDPNQEEDEPWDPDGSRKDEVEVYQHQAHKVTDRDLDPLDTGIVHNKYPLKFRMGR